MDSNRIKNVALGAREALMQEVDAALERVLATDSPERVANSQAVGTIERTVSDRGRENVVEQVAYTWFNRLCALRYMDVRGYTPVGLVSPRPGETLPAVLADARRGIYAAGLDISQRDKGAINAVLSGDTTARDPLGRAYVMLLVVACKTYERSMDYLFGAGRDLGPAIELLAPTDLLSEGSLLQRICAGLDETTCNEGVEVMGWLYQFYVSERKDAFFASKKKATAADIAPATQLFTPNWIVRYLVENSLGRLWMLNFPDSELKNHMDYYVEPEGPEEGFLKIYSPEDITFLDPACGSGHILVYAFDLLYLMYEEEGYRPADIPALILKNNLTGIEIDDRAAEIASFCLEMKALERDADFLNRDVDANIAVTHKFNPTEEERRLIPWFFADGKLMEQLRHLDEIGSLFAPPEDLSERIRQSHKELANDGSLDAAKMREYLSDLARVISLLGAHYSVVCANPPYMGIKKMNPWLVDWVKSNMPKSKADLCTCFVERGLGMLLKYGYAALITQQAWLFKDRYELFRSTLLHQGHLRIVVDLGAGAFDSLSGEMATTTSFVMQKSYQETIRFFDLTKLPSPNSKEQAFRVMASSNEGYVKRADEFFDFPASAIAYQVPDKVRKAYAHRLLQSDAVSFQGIITGETDRNILVWHEVPYGHISYDNNTPSMLKSYQGFIPYVKGGEFRRWYGNDLFVVRWTNNGESFTRSRTENRDHFFKGGLTWTDFSTNEISFRLLEKSFLFDASGPSIMFYNTELLPVAFGYMNSSVFQLFTQVNGKGIHYGNSCILSQPTPIVEQKATSHIRTIVDKNVNLSRTEWNAYEASRNFLQHPLVLGSLISASYAKWELHCQNIFDQLKANEEELNRIFARIYGMEGEVPIEVPDDKVSVRLADLGRDIRSLVSYGVGCMFGRYSLDEPGLILADEGSTLDDYHALVPNPTFEPDRTGIIPITDGDTEWFEDDIVAQFRRWLAAAYGQDTLDENVAFIEHALGKSLRAYFMRDFYDDHLKTYQKRPIYWLFQSPKKGLSALVYLHRYNPNTVTTLLTEYVRPLREQMDAQARLLEVTGNARDASTATKYRATIEELDTWEHDVIFPLSQKHVALDLDDGVKANYGKPEFKGALRKVTGLN